MNCCNFKTIFKWKFLQRVHMIVITCLLQLTPSNTALPSQQNNYRIARGGCKFALVPTTECLRKTSVLLVPRSEYWKSMVTNHDYIYIYKWTVLTVTLAPVKRLMRRMCLQNSGPWESRSLSLLVTKSRAWIISCNSVWNNENHQLLTEEHYTQFKN